MHNHEKEYEWNFTKTRLRLTMLAVLNIFDRDTASLML